MRLFSIRTLPVLQSNTLPVELPAPTVECLGKTSILVFLFIKKQLGGGTCLEASKFNELDDNDLDDSDDDSEV
jgi:hypothetical protein